eukprot:TRINITY_DN60013_c0_g1_i1.p1 TRINITY_DN60013_c0_g1~~TRINITY_DN60013_c0_g1_i1.p1  ORF type:complete len:1527 (-),score=489.88 TRINITY_DN60013_c0_g1_i1:695-5275(-)
MDDLATAYKLTQDASFTRDADYYDTHHHCTGMIRMLPDYSDVFMAQDTWSDYRTMTRVFKEYDFPLQHKNVNAHKITFSSYPGVMTSQDDFYLTDTKLMVLETTMNIFNSTLYKDYVKPQSLLMWPRMSYALRTSVDGPSFAENMLVENSGTYNNEYVVVDMKKFTPGKAPRDNFVYILEQFPGPYSHHEDVTNTELKDKFYVESINTPRWTEQFDIGGYPEQCEKYDKEYGMPNYWTFDKCSRHNIIVQQAPKIMNFEDFKTFMRYNDWKHDPLQNNDAGQAILSRYDLRTDKKKATSFGGMDSKCAKLTEANDGSLKFHVISSPQYETQPAWVFGKNGNFPDTPYWGLPEVWKFPWTEFQIDGEQFDHKTGLCFKNFATNTYSITYDTMENKGSALAHAYYEDTIQDIGFAKLHVHTNPMYADEDTMYCAGLLEGDLTHKRIKSHFTMFKDSTLEDLGGGTKITEWPAGLVTWMRDNIAYVKKNVLEHKDEPYWQSIGIILNHFNGLRDGANRHNDTPYSELDYWMLQSAGDMDDLSTAYRYYKPTGEVEPRNRDNFWFEGHHHCTGMVRLLDDFSDVFFSQDTWSSYTTLTRIMKEYDFPLNNAQYKTNKVTFSSYPGVMFSMDDFYTLDTELLVLETTFHVFDETLYKQYVKPQSVLMWMRISHSLRVADSGPAFANAMITENSGTYNNEYVILDMKKWTPGVKPEKNFAYILENFPGPHVEQRDVTEEELIKDGYVSSLNTPRWEDLFEISGYKKKCEEWAKPPMNRGYYWSKDKNARYLISKRDVPKIKTFEEFRNFMRYNNWEHDELSHHDPGQSILSRYDMRPPSTNPHLRPFAFGGLDSKCVKGSEFKKSQGQVFHIISSPEYEMQPVWKFGGDGQYKDVPHIDLPLVWEFPWTTFEAYEFEFTPKIAGCYLDGKDKTLKVDNGADVLKKENIKKYYAYGTWSDDIHKIGYAKLHVHTNKKFNDEDTMYCAGVVEGALSRHRFKTHYDLSKYYLLEDFEGNFPGTVASGDYPKIPKDWMNANMKYFNDNIAEKKDKEDYWYFQSLVSQQLNGLLKGLNMEGEILNMLDMWFFQSNGDMDDLNTVFKLLKADAEGVTPKETSFEYYEYHNHCSGMVRLLPDFSDVYFSQDTWSPYHTMTRVMKQYDFPLNTKIAKADTMTFSSYPAQMTSQDDFYLLDTDLMVLETTFDIFNETLYKEYVKPESVLMWPRISYSLRHAHDGPSFADSMLIENSGTYSNEYVVLDMSKFTPGEKPEDNFVYILEQMPGPYSVQQDVTKDELINKGYVFSINGPRFQSIYDIAGYHERTKLWEEKYHLGYYWTTFNSSRYHITEHRMPDVKTFEEFQAFMRYNDWKNNPDSNDDPGQSILSRFDLREGLPYPRTAKPFGGLDSKVAKFTEVKDHKNTPLKFHVVSSPQYETQPAWEFGPDSKFPNERYDGLPKKWSFPWGTFQAENNQFTIADGEHTGWIWLFVILLFLVVIVGSIFYYLKRPSSDVQHQPLLPSDEEIQSSKYEALEKV